MCRLLGTEVFQITCSDGAIVAEARLDDVTGGVFDSRLGGASSPLPLEPIGIGAVWEIDQVIDTDGVRIIQTVTTTLTDVFDSRVEPRHLIRRFGHLEDRHRGATDGLSRTAEIALSFDELQTSPA